MQKENILARLFELHFKADHAKKLVDEGKEVLCSHKLQGLLTNLQTLINDLQKEGRENIELDEKSSG